MNQNLRAILNEHGHELLDDTPVAVPVELKRPPSTLDEIRRALALVSREAAQQGLETFEEADDFDVEDEHDFESPWELSPDQLIAEWERANGRKFEPSYSAGAADPGEAGVDAPGGPGEPPPSASGGSSG